MRDYFSLFLSRIPTILVCSSEMYILISNSLCLREQSNGYVRAIWTLFESCMIFLVIVSTPRFFIEPSTQPWQKILSRRSTTRHSKLSKISVEILNESFSLGYCALDILPWSIHWNDHLSIPHSMRSYSSQDMMIWISIISIIKPNSKKSYNSSVHSQNANASSWPIESGMISLMMRYLRSLVRAWIIAKKSYREPSEK